MYKNFSTREYEACDTAKKTSFVNIYSVGGKLKIVLLDLTMELIIQSNSGHVNAEQLKWRHNITSLCIWKSPFCLIANTSVNKMSSVWKGMKQCNHSWIVFFIYCIKQPYL